MGIAETDSWRAAQGLTRRTEETFMGTTLSRFVRDSDGQDLIEYALLAGTLALGTLVALQGIQTAINNLFTSVSTTVSPS